MKARFKIEKHDHRIHGHSGLGRLTLRGRKGIVFDRLTDKQAAKIIGESILKVCYAYREKEKLQDTRDGVQINIEIVNYKL